MLSSQKRKNKTIVVPFASIEEYQSILSDRKSFRKFLCKKASEFPQIFPTGFQEGFHFHGLNHSKKLKLSFRRIRLLVNRESYLIHPSFAMPYLVGYTSDLSPVLMLRRWNVPYWALAEIFGHSASFWRRACHSLGRNHLVGTTAKTKESLPQHLNADEKHINYYKQKAYIATTTAQNCFWGSSLALSANEKELTQAYGICAQEFREIAPKHHVKTVLTDGWEATQNAFSNLFPNITVILCFFHAFLSIRKTLPKKKNSEVYQEVCERIWHVYRGETFRAFALRLGHLRKWTLQNIDVPKIREKILRLCARKERYRGGYEHEEAYRTSNQLDRLMDHQDRQLYAMRHMNGLPETAELHLRAMALCWNFHLYSPKTRKEKGALSPFEELNGFRYHDDWLENLNIASSLKGLHHLH